MDNLRVGIVSDHKRVQVHVIDNHNKRQANKHKTNIDVSRTHLNYHSIETSAKTQLKEIQKQYEQYVLSSGKVRKSMLEKGKLLASNEQHLKKGVHSLVFQFGGEESYTDGGFNFNEYFNDCLPEEEKLKILRRFGNDFNAWVQNEFPKIAGKNCKGTPKVIDFSIHMDETTPHLHMAYITINKNGRFTEGLFNDMHFNKAMNDFTKQRLVELLQDYALKRVLSNDFPLNDINRRKIEELSKITAKNDIQEGLRKKFMPKFTPDVYNELKIDLNQLNNELENLKASLDCKATELQDKWIKFCKLEEEVDYLDLLEPIIKIAQLVGIKYEQGLYGHCFINVDEYGNEWEIPQHLVVIEIQNRLQKLEAELSLEVSYNTGMSL